MRITPALRARVVCALLVLMPVGVAAQQRAPAAVERRARVTWQEGSATRRDIGAVLLVADSLRLRSATREVVSLPLARVTRLEVSIGRRRRPWWHGALFGAAAGAIVGGLAGDASHEACDAKGGNACWFVSDHRHNDILLGAAVWSVPGSIVGTGVSLLLRTDRWADSTILLRKH